MALPGETIMGSEGTGDFTCSECGMVLPLKVLKTCAYYIGTFCPNCGPYSRESGYYRTEGEAEAALKSGDFRR